MAKKPQWKEWQFLPARQAPWYVRAWLKYRKHFPKKPKPANFKDLTMFTRQFCTLLAAGVPITKTFDAFIDPNDTIHQTLALVGEKVEGGARLSAAMRGYPHVFSPIYCGLVESGEQTGKLVEVLTKLADDLEKQMKVRNRLSAALTYPAILLIAATGCITFFLTSVLPLLEPMFTTMHIPLPWATRVLLNLKYIVPAVAVAFAFFGALFVVFYRYMKRDPSRHRSIHYIFLFFPLLGSLYKTLVVTRVLQSLATMLDVGVPLLAAFRACETLTTNQYIIYLIASVRKLVVEGETMTAALQKNPLFPPAVVQLVAAGEETSDLIAMFKFSAKILEEDTDIVIDKMSVNLEPIIMAIMGVVVGFIVIAAMLPITQLLQNL